jgi:hypothetical protein
LSAPTNGQTVSGTTPVTATATDNVAVASVQLLLDGQALGAPVTSPPYTVQWDTTKATPGLHTLGARATDTSGNTATATTVTVTVPDTTPPTVAISNPSTGQTVSGTQPVAANVADNVAIGSVQFLLDGQALGAPVTSAPYAVQWDTTKSTAGSHTLSARATDTSGNATTSLSITVSVQNPAPTMTCFVLQTQTSVHGRGTVTTPAISTLFAGEVLLAFVSADGPATAATQSVTVSGGTLQWRLVKRGNAQLGDAEVWTATATAPVTNLAVRSTPARTGYDQDLTVVAMEGALGVGASSAAAGSTTAPAVSLTTTAGTSLVFAVGNDWDRATARTYPAGQVQLEEWVDSGTGDTYWSEYTNAATGPAGTVVRMSASSPAGDRWNLVSVELLGAG